MGEQRDRQLDRIIGREKPGFERVAVGRSHATARMTGLDGGTADVMELRAKAEALGIRPVASRRRGQRGSAAGPPPVPSSRVGSDRARSARGMPSHHILTVRHVRHDEADPLPSRVIVVSHKDRRIVGEQG